MNAEPAIASSVTLPDGRSLDLYVGGNPNGQALVFHHGSPGAGMMSPGLVRAAFERGLRVIAWTRPGYGSSTRLEGRDIAAVAADAEAVLDHLGAETCHAIGWSGGGAHALACAALLPDRVVGVATIGSVAPYLAEGLDWLAGMGAENVEEFGYSLGGPEALLPRMPDAWEAWRHVAGDQVAAAFGDLVDDVDRASITGEFAESVAADFREGLREGYLGWFDEDLAFVRPWGFDPSSIRVPVHVWQGRHDRMVPYAHGEWLAAHIPTACPHLHEDHGHLTLVVDAVGEIIDELVGAR